MKASTVPSVTPRSIEEGFVCRPGVAMPKDIVVEDVHGLKTALELPVVDAVVRKRIN